VNIPPHLQGLHKEQVQQARLKYGTNEWNFKAEKGWWKMVKQLVSEPMVIMLLAASCLYFISGKTADALFLSAAILLVAAISAYQHRRSTLALEKLKKYTRPFCKVIREGNLENIPAEELVMGDYLLVEEGNLVAADGKIIYSSDLGINESIITGESMVAMKDAAHPDPYIYQGTHITNGMAVVEITAAGMQTRLGKIGKSLSTIQEEATPLEKQISGFVKWMVLSGFIVFLIVWLINYIQTQAIIPSLLQALTLAMSILPEEIPVAFTTFMALGAWRLMQKGIIVKQMKTVETLGSADIICTDKTGTLTKNEMSLVVVYCWPAQKTFQLLKEGLTEEAYPLIRIGMWASEPIPFDPMEQELHNQYSRLFPSDERLQYQLIHEYPLAGKPPMMTHIFENKEQKRIIAAKGAPEAIVAVCNLLPNEREHILNNEQELASKGYRILGVAESTSKQPSFPTTQQEILFEFIGLLAFYDPPKENIRNVLQQFNRAGIQVKILTGDNPVTTREIARQVELPEYEAVILGDEIMQLEGKELHEAVEKNQLFTRMFPEAKLKVIQTLQALGHVVAMTGDGVNDGPALKAAHIGIAMGKKGTELAQQAASLILPNDDLSGMLEAVAMGRKIYTNLKKAIRYIISIHIPIVLLVFFPLVLGWIYPNIFSPIHVIFFELIMGPTCSIIYENEPAEANILLHPPRRKSMHIFNLSEIFVSILQGLVITIGCLLMYQWGVKHQMGEAATRTLVFTTLILSNIFLTLENRSFRFSIVRTLFYQNRLLLIIIGITAILSAIILLVTPIQQFFKLDSISISNLALCLLTAFLSVIWLEVPKWIQRSKKNRVALFSGANLI
jgi:Ca2+-transporting ATPase